MFYYVILCYIINIIYTYIMIGSHHDVRFGTVLPLAPPGVGFGFLLHHVWRQRCGTVAAFPVRGLPKIGSSRREEKPLQYLWKQVTMNFKKNWGCLKIGSLYTPFHPLIHHFPNEIDIFRGDRLFSDTPRDGLIINKYHIKLIHHYLNHYKSDRPRGSAPSPPSSRSRSNSSIAGLRRYLTLAPSISSFYHHFPQMIAAEVPTPVG